MACCKAIEFGGWCLTENTVWTDEDGNEYCVYHAPKDKKGISSERFNNLIFDKLDEDKSLINLTGTIFPDRIHISNKTLPRVVLSYSYFHGELVLSALRFKDRFEFNNCYFDKNVRLHAVTFEESMASQSCYFHSSLFIKETSCYEHLLLEFELAPSKLELALESANNVIVQGNNNDVISKAFFEIKKANPSTLLRINKLDFHDIKFPYALVFPVWMDSCSLNYFSSIQHNLLYPITFSICTFEQIYLAPSTISNVNLFGCTYPTALGRPITSDAACWEVITPAPNQKKRVASAKELEELYRRLKKKEKNDEASLLTSAWHYWEKHFAQQRARIEADWGTFVILWLYHMLSSYGESVKRAAGILCLILFFSIALGILKYTGIYLTDGNTESIILVNPNGLGFLTSKGYVALKFIWTNFSWHEALQSTFDFIPLATKAPDTKVVSLWRPLELFWQAVITFQATLLGFALRNRYRR